jgi:6-pyruvoyltetrahydropterin/6-carboxytetrahydropterin synthase
MISVTKKFSFSYAHHLPEYDGDCQRVHGHNSNVEVEFSNQAPIMPAAYPGMVVDFKIIKKIVDPIIDELDHHDLNQVIVGNPTAENIAQWIADKIGKTSIGAGLVRVQVSETDDSFATWRKEK